MADALRTSGVDVWFDQSELRGGDAWDHKIRQQIKECALFVPIISAHTQTRTEGYFRLEWHLAEQRSHLIARGRPFIMPVSIDDTRDADALVPDAFLAVQWTRVRDDAEARAFAERAAMLLRGSTSKAVSSVLPARTPEPAPVGPRSRRHWRWLIGATLVLAAGASAYLARPGRSSSSGSATVSEARQLALRGFDPVSLGTPSRAQLVTAEALCDRALALDPTDPEIWIIAAKIDLRFILNAYDPSAARREKAMNDAARAVGLAPDLFDARAIKATILATVATTDAMRADAEAQLLALLKERPEDHTSLSLLAVLTRKAGRFAESADYFERIDSPGGAAWSYYYGEDFPRAEEATERSLKKGRTPTMITLKANLAEVYREDVAAACAIFREVPASAMLQEGPAFNAVRFAFLGRRPDEALQILGALPQDYFSILDFSGPKALLTGKAHAMAGRPEAARADWQVALGVVEKKLAGTPNDPELLFEKAEVLACLGEKAGAEETLRLASQLAGSSRDEISLRTIPIHVRLGHLDQVLAFLSTALAARGNGWRLLHARARFEPDFDPLRNDPRFEQLLRETLPEGAKPFDDAPGGPIPDPATDSR